MQKINVICIKQDALDTYKQLFSREALFNEIIQCAGEPKENSFGKI